MLKDIMVHTKGLDFVMRAVNAFEGTKQSGDLVT